MNKIRICLFTFVALTCSANLSLASTTCVTTTLAALQSVGSCTWTSSAGSTITFDNFNLINNDDFAGGAVPASNWNVTFIDNGLTFRIDVAPINPITESAPSSGQGASYQFLWRYLATVTTTSTD